jgi:hypothetical protein
MQFDYSEKSSSCWSPKINAKLLKSGLILLYTLFGPYRTLYKPFYTKVPCEGRQLVAGGDKVLVHSSVGVDHTLGN